MSKREWAIAAGVVALAAVLRMGWPGLTEFKLDEAHLYSLALDMAEFKAFYLRGIGSSVGLPNAPISVYLFALPLLVWKSPLAATLWVGLLNTASVALTYALARRYWGARVAFTATVLYAVSPWAVIYSRKIWAQDLLPLFVTGWLFTALLTFAEGRRKWLLAHFVLLVLAVQIHFSAIALAPVTLAALIIFRRQVDWRVAGWGALAALLTAAPFAVYALLHWGAGGSAGLLARPIQLSLDALSLAALVIQGTEIHSLAGAQAFRAFLASVPNFYPVLWLGGALVLGGLALALRRWRSAPHLILALSALLPIAFFIPHLTPVYPHYFIILFPAPYLLAGIFWEALRQRWPARGWWAVPLAMALSQVWLSLALLRFISTQNTPGGFGPPLEKLLLIAEQTRGADDVLVMSDGADSNTDTVPAVFSALLRPSAPRFADARTTAVFPAQAATIIVWPSESPGAQAYQNWNIPQTRVPLRAGEGEALLLHADGSAPAVPLPREASALLSNGAEVLGSGGNAALWEWWWRAPGPPDAHYQVFAHLLNADGARVAQVDEAAYADWRAGDLVVNYFALNDAGVNVRVGMYAYPSLEPVSVLNANGEPAGEWVEFPVVSNQ